MGSTMMKMTTSSTATTTRKRMNSCDSSYFSRKSLLNPKQKNCTSKFAVPIKSSAAQSISKPLAFRQGIQRRNRSDCNSNGTSTTNSWSQPDDLDFQQHQYQYQQPTITTNNTEPLDIFDEEDILLNVDIAEALAELS